MSLNQGPEGPEDTVQEDVGSSVIAALSASVARIFERYSQQWDTTKQMVSTEWELTLKCLWLALLFIIVLMSVVVVTWLGINAVIAYGLFSMGVPVWGIALVNLAIQILTILVLSRTIRGLFKEVGFGRSLAVFKSAEPEKEDSTTATMPPQSGGL